MIQSFPPNQSPATTQNSSRTGLFSLRKVDRHVCRCLGYEFEDCVQAIDNATLYQPEPKKHAFSPEDSFITRVVSRAIRRKLTWSIPPRIAPFSDLGEHELFFAFCQNLNDLSHLKNLADWRAKSRVTACWIDECWLAAVKKHPRMLRLLDKIDFVFVTFHETTSYLQKLGINAYHIPAGIDSLAFCPLPGGPDRTIDVLAMGRKPPATHRELFERFKSDHINYFFDTSPLLRIESHVEHRTLMAKLIGRSKIFLVQRAKADCPEQTMGQIEVGSRYFEGCAGGAVLVGEKLEVPTFREQFGWEDAVIHLDYDSSDISVILDLLEDRDRINQIHQRNLYHSLLKHDWAYRWESMLQKMNLSPTPALEERKRKLRSLAESIPIGLAEQSVS